jgi:integral membrane protein
MSPERRFHWVAYAEGASFLLLLLIAMPLKYWAGMPLPNRVLGLVHGVLFVVYVVQVCEALGAGRFTLRTAALALLASLLPLGPFVFERRVGGGARASGDGDLRQ